MQSAMSYPESMTDLKDTSIVARVNRLVWVIEVVLRYLDRVMLFISRKRDDSREQGKGSAGFVLHRPESRKQRLPSEFNRPASTFDVNHAEHEGIGDIRVSASKIQSYDSLRIRYTAWVKLREIGIASP